MLQRAERSSFAQSKRAHQGNSASFDCAAKNAAPLRKPYFFLVKTLYTFQVMIAILIIFLYNKFVKREVPGATNAQKTFGSLTSLG